MKQLAFEYTLKATYSSPIRRHNFAFSFLPADTCRQRITALSVSVCGCPGFREATGAFGNGKIYGCVELPHDIFEIHICGRAETGLDIFESYTSDPLDGAVFRAQTPLTAPGDAIRAYHDSLALHGSNYEKATYLMHSLHETLQYFPGATLVHEPAETAFAQGRGVCQDYAHMMLSLLRMEGIPARYVTGMAVGEGASHAWVEALCNGYWYGFDPTNDLLVDDSYLRAACGRDSADCAIIRGTFYGLAEQMQQEQVLVQEETV